MKTKLFFFLLFLSSSYTFSQLTLIGPNGSINANVSYCDAHQVLLVAESAYFDDDFDNVDWRYVFSLWSNGQNLLEYTNNNDGNWSVSNNDYNFQSGPYQIRMIVQHKWGPFWITDETIWSNGINLNFYGVVGQYDTDKMEYLTVSGDFDRDGKEDDVATFYSYGTNNTKLHVWKSSGSYLDYLGDNGWWQSTTYNASKIKGRVVAGDFDRDGFKDDIAAFYDYGNNHTRIHVWSSTGNSFVFAGEWWVTGSGSNGYNANLITGRVVSGDFNRDGFFDDIAVFYDYGNNTTQIHLLKSTGNSFNFLGTWYNSGSGNFNSNQLNYTLISGDFNRDGFHDDIVGFYGFNNFQTKAFAWRSLGTSFMNPTIWYDSGVGNFDITKIRGRVVSTDFDRDGYKDDIAVLYEYPNFETKAFVWRSTGTSLGNPVLWFDSGLGNFDATKVTGRVVAGDYDNDNYSDDLVCYYNYGNLSCRSFMLSSTGNNFSSIIKVWEACNPATKNIDGGFDFNSDQLSVYPNPSTGVIKVSNPDRLINRIEIVTMAGNVSNLISNYSEDFIELDLSHLSNGMYIIRIYSENEVINKKISIVH